MQLLDTVLACPSWCNDGVARLFWCRGRFLAQFILGNLVHFPVRSRIWRHVFGVWVFFLLYRALDSSGDDLFFGRHA